MAGIGADGLVVQILYQCTVMYIKSVCDAFAALDVGGNERKGAVLNSC